MLRMRARGRANWFLLTDRGELMTATKLHDALTEALDCIKAGGLIGKYSLAWDSRSDAPRIVVWKASDIPDEELRRLIANGLAGLAAESQFTIEKR
jgi:hypothetical protein